MPTTPDQVIDQVRSLCTSCGGEVPALVVEREGRVYHRTRCKQHGTAERLVFSSAALYRKLETWNQWVFSPAEAGLPAGEQAADEAPDNGAKPPTLAVIDLTNRCNFVCPVCFADASARGEYYYLDLGTVRRMLQALLEGSPVPCRHVQFSGGEPTLHPQFLEILKLSRELGFTHIQVATNGSRFADLEYLRQCEEAGLHTLYLQFDGVSDEVYVRLRGRPLFSQKLAVVENVAQTSLRIVLVPTIASSVNVDQIGPIFRFALEHSRQITGISVQPMADTGRLPGEPHEAEAFNLADMALEFGRQTGLTRFPDDWFPLSAITMITRGISRLRGELMPGPACDAHCALGTYFYIDEDNQPWCVNRFFDMERFFRELSVLPAPGKLRGLGRQISRLRGLNLLAGCFDQRGAPKGLTFARLLRNLDTWEDKGVGRGPGWDRRGFNGLFVAGMHFMDRRNYNFRRLRRCIIKYVTTEGEVVSFCSYNSGARYRAAEESARLQGLGARRCAAS